MAHLTSIVSLLLLQLLVLCAGSRDARHAVARSPQGAARGIAKTSLNGRSFWAFYNLPFAKPPIGSLRFKDPVPADRWNGIRDATVPGTHCIQKNWMLVQNYLTGSEDCLYLNVFTPQLSESLPVMLYIHGGGWVGSGAEFYDPDYLLDHDVILVTVNYRLGALGFLSTQDESARGNFGLKDNVAALQWVRDNIAAFGGNPNCVTIFGESAGAGNVHLLMLSPLSQGLFHRAISESGTALSAWDDPNDQAAESARRLASMVGCPESSNQELIECLRNVDASNITLTQELLVDGFLPFRPVVEGEHPGAFLPKYPRQLKPAGIPWMTGLNKKEEAFNVARIYMNKTFLNELQENFTEVLPNYLVFSDSPNAKLIAQKIEEYYFSSRGFSLQRFTDICTDRLFTVGTDEAVRWHRNFGPVYYYLFTYRGSNTYPDIYGPIDIDLGVSHVDELFYLFPIEKLLPGAKLSQSDFEVVKIMTKLWTNFAKTGNPIPDNRPKWPKVSSGNELEYMEIERKLKVKKGLFQDRVNFWKSLPPLK